MTKNEEKTNGADVGVVVDVRVPGGLQLHTLLEHSASAVYWLICCAGDVLVVPAKFLVAIENATARPSSKQFTVGYAAVRHTAILLEQ